MYCKNCDSQIEDNFKFCPYCGARVMLEESTPIENDIPTDQPEEVETQITDVETEEPIVMESTEKSRLPKFLIPLLVIVAAAVVVLIAVGVRSSNRLDLNKYAEVNINGYEGHGTANVSFDWDALSRKYDGKVKVSSSGWGLVYGSFSELLNDCVYMYVEPTSGLSNGDEVTVSWDVDTEALNDLIDKKIKISAEPKTYKVSGLEEVSTFDAFEGVDVQFSGTSPNATAVITVTGNTANQLKYTLSQASGLAIGDAVTVTIDEASANTYMQEHGVYPAEMEKTFVVEGVPYYVSSLDEIPADAMEKLMSQAEDVFRAAAATWSENARLDSLDYLGSYFLCEKSGVNMQHVNIIYMVYEPQATQFGKTENGSQTETLVDYFWYIGFYNGMVLENGTFTIDYSDYTVPSDSWGVGDGFSVTTYDYTQQYSYLQDITLSYTGFENLGSMFNNLVTAKIDNYTYESTVNGTISGGGTSSGTTNTEDIAGEISDADSRMENTEEGEETDHAEEDETASDGSGEYLCSYSSDRLITESDLAEIRTTNYGTLPAGESLEQMIINEIYARHGYKFSTEEIQAYFEQKDWYNAIGSYESDMSVVSSSFSDIEKQNVEYLSGYLVDADLEVQVCMSMNMATKICQSG